MWNENLNPHDIGPPDEEHTEDHDSDGIASILEIFSQEKLNKVIIDNQHTRNDWENHQIINQKGHLMHLVNRLVVSRRQETRYTRQHDTPQ